MANRGEVLQISIVALFTIAICLLFLYAYGIKSNPEANTEGIRLHGHFHGELYDKEGNLKQVVDKDNLIVTTGFKGLAKLVWNANSGVSPSTYRYIALGTGTTAPASTDTALQTESSYSRQLTSSPTYSSSVTTITGSFTGQTCVCTEIGVFDASTSGNMISRQTFSAINTGSSDTLVITYTFTVS